ncbi:MAG TPA: hypothetical protein VF177_08520 [Anaerolineae bacterium]
MDDNHDYHVANNWTLIEGLDAAGAIVNQASTAALNPAQIAH